MEGFASAIRAQVIGNFGTCHWFAAWIYESEAQESSFTRVRFEDSAGLMGPTFTPWIEREEVERLVGAELPSLPTTEHLRDLVLAAGGVEEEEGHREYRLFLVEDFPPPHNPARCAHHPRFQEIATTRQANDRSAGDVFLSSLTKEDFAACSYHEGDWNQVASVSVAILEALGCEPEDEELRRAISDAALPERERKMLYWLFYDPIVASRDHGFTNGKHRACAIRASGAEIVVVAD